MRIASLLGGFISKKSSVFVPACAGQTGDDVRAKRPPAGDGNGGWKQKGKVPKTLDFIGFSALWMAHPEELESTAYCLGGSRSIPLSYGCMYAVLRSHPSRPKTNTVGLFRSFFQAEAHNRFLCHAMAKIAIKSGGFRRLHYARHFPLRYRLQRMELPKKIAPISESYF